MTQQPTKFSLDQRRAGVRRTAWIAGLLAFGFFVAFFVMQAMARP